jgi:hypothetical protein
MSTMPSMTDPAIFTDLAPVGDGLDSDFVIARYLRTERDAGRLAYDASDRPTAGSNCWLCRAGQPAIEGVIEAMHSHNCPAKGYLGDYAVCAECGRGKACGWAIAVDKMQHGFGEMEQAESCAAGPVSHVPLEEAHEEFKPFEHHPWQAVKELLSVENLRMGKRRVQPGRMPQRAVVLPSPPKSKSNYQKDQKPCLGGCHRMVDGRCKSGKCKECRKPAKRTCAGCGCPIAAQVIGDRCKSCRRAAEKVVEVKLEVKSNGKQESEQMKTRISDEVKAQVKAEPEDVSYTAIAKKYGISDASVNAIRGPKYAQGKPAKKAAKKKPGKKAGAKPITNKPPAAAVTATRALGIVTPANLPSVSLCVPEAALDRMWQRLTVPEKARLVEIMIVEGVGA